MRPYFLFIYLFFKFIHLTSFQHNITINLTTTGRKKGGETVKKNNKQIKSEIRKFNRLTTTGRANRRITIARVC